MRVDTRIDRCEEREKRSWKRGFRVFASTLVLGFTIALPIGPISLLVINRTLARGWRYGLTTGVGVALADATYAAIAVSGLSALSQFLVNFQTPIRTLGALFLIYLAIRTLVRPPAAREASLAESPRRLYLGAIASAWALTVTNPLTILMFVSIFAGAGLAVTPAAGSSAALLALATVLGIFGGSLCVWLLLSGGATLLRERAFGAADGRGLRWLNRIGGALLLIFALRVLLQG